MKKKKESRRYFYINGILVLLSGSKRNYKYELFASGFIYASAGAYTSYQGAVLAAKKVLGQKSSILMPLGPEQFLARYLLDGELMQPSRIPRYKCHQTLIWNFLGPGADKIKEKNADNLIEVEVVKRLHRGEGQRQEYKIKVTKSQLESFSVGYQFESDENELFNPEVVWVLLNGLI